MKIERNNNMIRATLTPEDCLEYDISVEDLKNNRDDLQDKIHEICSNILEELKDKDLAKNIFSVKVGAVGENIVVEMCPSTAPSLLDVLKNIIGNIPDKEEEEPSLPENISSTRRLIHFKNMNEAIDFCKVAETISFLKNTFIKYDGTYYLDVSFDEKKTDAVDMFLSEFVIDKVEKTNSRITYIFEHSEHIISDNAISTLAQI